MVLIAVTVFEVAAAEELAAVKVLATVAAAVFKPVMTVVAPPLQQHPTATGSVVGEHHR